MTKDTTIHLPPIFDHADFSVAAAAIKTLLTKPSTDDYIHIVETLASAQSSAQRHIHYLEHRESGVRPTGMPHDIDACYEVVKAIRMAWSAHAEIHASALRPTEFDLRPRAASALVLV